MTIARYMARCLPSLQTNTSLRTLVVVSFPVRTRSPPTPLLVTVSRPLPNRQRALTLFVHRLTIPRTVLLSLLMANVGLRPARNVLHLVTPPLRIVLLLEVVALVIRLLPNPRMTERVVTLFLISVLAIHPRG